MASLYRTMPSLANCVRPGNRLAPCSSRFFCGAGTVAYTARRTRNWNGLVRSQRQHYLDNWLTGVSARLLASTVALLETSIAEADGPTSFNTMRSDAGQASLDNILMPSFAHRPTNRFFVSRWVETAMADAMWFVHFHVNENGQTDQLIAYQSGRRTTSSSSTCRPCPARAATPMPVREGCAPSKILRRGSMTLCSRSSVRSVT